jgi:tripartite motif-containing protein 71
VYRFSEVKSHSVIGTFAPARTAITVASIFATALLALAAVTSHAQSEPKVTPLYDGVGSDYVTRLSTPMGIYYDTVKNECYVADTGNGQVVVFDASGMPVFRFYHYVTGRGATPVAGQPQNLTVDKTGRIYLVDTQAPYLDVLDPQGRSIVHIDVPADKCGAPERFTHVTQGTDGTIYALTGCTPPRVAVIHDLAIANMTTLHNPDGDHFCVTGFAADLDGRLWLTSACGTKMVQLYAQDGSQVRAFGKHDTGYENFAFPAGIAVGKDGSLWVADSIRQILVHFDNEGNLLAMIGGKGTQPGSFEYPCAVATDGANRVYVLERQGGRYQCLEVLDAAATKN